MSSPNVDNRDSIKGDSHASTNLGISSEEMLYEGRNRGKPRITVAVVLGFSLRG